MEMWRSNFKCFPLLRHTPSPLGSAPLFCPCRFPHLWMQLIIIIHGLRIWNSHACRNTFVTPKSLREAFPANGRRARGPVNNLPCPKRALPAEAEQGGALPSCSHSHAANKHPYPPLRVMWFLHTCGFFSWLFHYLKICCLWPPGTVPKCWLMSLIT